MRPFAQFGLLATTSSLGSLFAPIVSRLLFSAMAAPVQSMATPRGEAFANSLPPLRPFHRRLFLLRHGQTDWNRDGLMQGGGFDIPLNDDGHEQARRVAGELSAIPFGVIASSHLQRALQTANALSEWSSCGVRLVDARLGEMRFGDFEGTCMHGPNAPPELLARYRALQRAMKQDVSVSWPGEDAESTLQVSLRGRAAMDALLERYPDESHLAVVAHGRFNKILLATLLWNDPSRHVEIEQGNTCINVLDFNEQDQTWSPICIDYFDHAPNADAKTELRRLAEQQQQVTSKSKQQQQ